MLHGPLAAKLVQLLVAILIDGVHHVQDSKDILPQNSLKLLDAILIDGVRQVQDLKAVFATKLLYCWAHCASMGSIRYKTSKRFMQPNSFNCLKPYS